MKKFYIIFISAFLIAPLSSQQREEKLTLIYNNTPLVKVLNDIEESSGINFIYSDNLIHAKKITCSIKNEKKEKAFSQILKNSDISYKIFDERSIVLFQKENPPVEKKLTPVVTNDNFIIKESSAILTKPVLIKKISPAYPVDAITRNIEGKVALKFFVDKKGDVSYTTIESTSGSKILDSAAVSYVEKLKFIPANANGEPKNIWMHMKFNYYFENQEE